MTIEEKAKAFNEAIIKAKALYGQPLVDNTLLETIFPELKESEDERIRKALIDRIECFNEKHMLFNNGVSKNKVIAWLEKQGVQKPAEWSEEDERIVTELIGIFESAVDGGHVTFPYRLVKDYIRVLKLCLPQSAWKPSDEQLDNLSRAFNGATYNNSLLMQLYIDLKKLKEE